MSKVYSLAGLRVGWIAATREVLDEAKIHCDDNTIAVGRIDEHFAAIALENRGAIIARSQKITRENLAVLRGWVEREPLDSWVKPRSGTTALLRYDLPIPSREFCVVLLEQKGVMLTPGSVMAMEGWLRIGFTNPTADLRKGRDRISAFLAQQLEHAGGGLAAGHSRPS